jgi:hypothetical protein
MQQTLVNPVGSTYVYSDLSMITMHFIIGGLAQKLGYVQVSARACAGRRYAAGDVVC